MWKDWLTFQIPALKIFPKNSLSTKPSEKMTGMSHLINSVPAKLKKLSLLLHLEVRGVPERLAGFLIYTTAFDMMLFSLMSILTLTA